MRSRRVDLQLIDENNRVCGVVEFLASDDGKNVALRCAEGLLAEKLYSGVDYFWTFGEMRDDLLALGYRPLCKGAVKNVFPGGMQGEVSLGLIAYILDAEGKGVGKVNIFDAASIEELEDVVSFQDHKEYRKKLSQNRRGRGIPTI